MIKYISKKSFIQFFAENTNDLENEASDNVNQPETEDGFDKEYNFETGDVKVQTNESNEKNPVLSAAFDLIEIFSYAIALMVIIFLFVIKFVTVDGNSMCNTLHDKEKLIIYNLFYTPETNDIIVINYNSDTYDELLVKRVIGVEGDEVKINFDTWEVWVNDELIDQSYIDEEQKKLSPMRNFNLTDVDDDNCVTFTVDEGKVFVMGDNRNGSLDSRSLGQLEADEIMGKVIFRVSPFDKVGTVK